jgi:hypothetical protein
MFVSHSLLFVAWPLLMPVADAPRPETVPYVDVTRTAETLGLPPVLPATEPEPVQAATNTARIKAIMEHPQVGTHCVVHFPAGTYHFAGAAEGWQGTIETTAPHQTIRGDGMHATRILQHGPAPDSVLRLRHDNAAVEGLFVGAGESSEAFVPDWEEPAERLNAAIHLDAPSRTGNPWSTDPRIRQVAINSYGNTVLQRRFSRPFQTGIRITGAWLNVYVDEVWMKDTAVGVYVDQGAIMAGPAKIMRVNHYTTHAPDRQSRMWTIFFQSQTHFMEQVELIHNTFIGAQFIRMDAAAEREGERTTPAYDMVIDHNYVNVHDVGQAGEARDPGPENSGIFMRLPPTVASAGPQNYSRDIRFTNNSCTGRAPSRGAFFYVEGMCRGLTFSHNDVSSPGIDKAIYIRATQRLEQDGVSRADDTAIRDVKITHNYFRSFRNLITIGGDADDPERLEQPVDSPARGRDDDRWWVQRVIIAHNQNMMEGETDTLGLTSCYLNRVRQAVVESNTFVETAGSALIVRGSEEISVVGNSFRGRSESRGRRGIALIDTQHATVTGNVLAQFAYGVLLERSRSVTVGNNVVRDADVGLRALQSQSVNCVGNEVSGAAVGIEASGNAGFIATSNQLAAARGLVVSTDDANREDHLLRGNLLQQPR